MNIRDKTYLLGIAILMLGALYLATHPLALAQSEVIFLPAVVAEEAETSGQSTPIALPTPISTATPVPTERPTETPTATPNASEILRYEGVTDRGGTVLLEVAPDLSRVYTFELEAQVTCANSSELVTVDLFEPLGYLVTLRTFDISVPSPGGHEHRFQGAFDSVGFGVTGTWSMWLDGESVLQPCLNKGNWSASRQTFDLGGDVP